MRSRDVPGRAAEAETRGPFRIHAVAELTGVPEPTLRAWERRYGIPAPERTASGYRLYSARDVEQVREMRRLCRDGMAASEAAKLLLVEKSSAAAAPSHGEFDPYAVSLAALLDAVFRFDDVALDLELRKLMYAGSTIAIVDRVLSPALHEIGKRWHEGALSVAQEHFASQKLGTLLRDLLRLSAGADSESRILFACFADEEHEIGLLATATRLSTWGFRPVFLGARTPPSAVRSAVLALSPALVALSVTLPPNRARARELIDEYASACGEVPWIVGGAAAPALADLVRARGGGIAPEDAPALRAVVRAAVERALPRSTADGKSRKTRR